MHKCKVFVDFTRNQPTKTMQVFRPTNHDQLTQDITADIIEILDGFSAMVLESEVIGSVKESADDQSAIIIANNGRRFRVQLWEIL